MAKCLRCGTEVSDTARFCVKCGVELNVYAYLTYLVRVPSGTPGLKFQAHTAYKYKKNMTERDFVTNLMTPSDSKRVENFILTDRSIIFHGKEISSADIRVITTDATWCSADSLQKKDGNIFFLYCIGEYTLYTSFSSELQLYRDIVRFNDGVEQVTLKQKFEYVLMMYKLLEKLSTEIHRYPVEYGDDPELDELCRFNGRIMYKPGIQVVDTYKYYLIEYAYNQKKLNKYCKENLGLYPNVGNNRSPECLAGVVAFMYEDDETPFDAMDRYVDFVRLRKAQKEYESELARQRREMEYYNQPNGRSFIGDVAKIAVGVTIGNKISGKSKKVKSHKSDSTHYTWTHLCPFHCAYKVPAWKNSKGEGGCKLRPEECGHGQRFR